VRNTVERNAATNHIGVAAHALLPEILRHHRYIGAVFFLRQKIATANRTHAEHIEIVYGHSAAKKLNGIAQSGQSEGKNVFGVQPVEYRLAIAVMLKARRRHRGLHLIAMLGIGIHVQNTCRLLEWQTAQKQIVDQTEDGSVQADTERERDYGEKSKSGRFAQLPESKAQVSNHNGLLSSQRNYWIDFQGASRGEIASGKSGQRKEEGDAEKNCRIARIHPVKK